MIPQPPLDALNVRTRKRLAPESQRIDLLAPTFTNSTSITNPLFPVSDLHSVLLLGKLDGRPWRAETTLLPETRFIDWNGHEVQTLESQFVAYLEGRIFEVAVDHYAQADDGSVWYLGENAFTYNRGRIADTEGTWLAGVEGPPALIMPAHPQVGNVYRTENVPGLVFEQVTVKAVDQTLPGPTGSVAGVVIAQEVHMDEVRLEDKVFAPGYGEFHSGSGVTFEATALAIPADAVASATPEALTGLSTSALDIVDSVTGGRWTGVASAVDSMGASWDAFRAGDVPALLAEQMDVSLASLRAAVGTRDPRAAALAALATSGASLDLQLRYRPPLEIDTARFDLWTRRLDVDAAAGDQNAAVGDVTTLQWIRDRLSLDPITAGRVDDALRYLEAATESDELEIIAGAPARLRATVGTATP
jgi:hypothetical protein